ncbi:uncharacterized protein EAF01_011066 [Botrytis porri]|uniref:uncharacterized protein n=1 Tax=Botrytis porri TaxID=87229 RepID=UPI00190209B4|nr:uncharacterized protein EAF01_011066 [Botrytis porri]KAF7887912.1 hypothetical protein EAF01_011066 [Botrytis porri]
MRQSVFALAALSLWQSCTAQGTKETLVPYHPRDIGLQRRDAPPSVTLQNELSLIWGSSNGSTFVNVTLNTGETELVISTEHFSDSLTDVQCNGDLVLTFKDNATFQDAIADWSWVNFHENRTFFMINNWGACAAASESGRQPWVVHGVDVYDEQNFIVNFNATLSDWDDVMTGAVIEFGAMSTSSSSKRTDTISKTLSLNMAHSLPQTFFSKSTNSGLDFSIDCPGCATTGAIDVQGKIVMNTVIGIPTSVKSISITTTPKGVGANLALGFSVSGTLGSGWTKDWNLVTVGLPGWSIPKIIDLGPQFTVDAGFALSGIEGSASISAGVNVAIPDSSSAVLGISGVDSSFNGWVPTATPQTPKVSVQVDGSLEMYTEIGLDVGLTVLSKWGFGGGLFLRIPDVKIDLGAEFNTQGVCPGSADIFGVTLGATVGVDLNLGVYTESGGDKSWKAKTSIYTNNNLITPIDKCFPLGPTLPAGGKVSIKTVGTVPVSSAKAVSTTKADSTSAKPISAVSSSKASAVSASATHKTSGSVSASSIKVSGTGVSSSIKVSGTTKPSSIKVSGTGVFSSKITGTGISGYGASKIAGTGVSSSKIVGTAVSSSAHGYGSAPASPSAHGYGSASSSSSALGYGAASAYPTTTKLSGTGVYSSSKVAGTGVTSAASYGTHPDTTASSIKGASTSTSKTSGTVVVSSSLYISASGVSLVKTAIGSSASSALGLETSKVSPSSIKATATGGAPAYGGSSTSSALDLETSKASSSSAKAATTTGAPVYGGSSTSSALRLETSKASSTAASSTHISSTIIASSTTTKAFTTVIPTKTATGTVAPAPIATGTISTCDKWVTIEDNNCSCTNIENYYGVSATNLDLWNPGLGSECKLTVGQAVCIGVKGSYKRSVNGRLARFIDA